MNGYDRAELCGRRVGVVHPRHQGEPEAVRLQRIDGPEPDMDEAYVQKLWRDRRLTGLNWHRRKDGTVFPVEIANALVTFEGHDYLLCVDRDVSAAWWNAPLLRGPLGQEWARVAGEGLPWPQLPSPQLAAAELGLPARTATIASPSDQRLIDVIAYMRLHFAEPLSVPVLAAQSGLSASRSAHLFRQETANTPVQFLECLRVEAARQHLATTALSIEEIARRVGYENSSYFGKRFRKQVGQSPTQYRERRPGVTEVDEGA